MKTEIRRAQAKFEEHARGGVFELAEIPAAAYERARQIARRRASVLGLGTLDILHVASALLLQAERFWTFDQRQSELAEAEGMRT